MTDDTMSDTLEDGSYVTGASKSRLLAHLFLVMECARPLVAGARFALEDLDEVIIGRGRERAFEREGRRLRLSVPDRWMSSTHARIARSGSEWALEDVSSTNGSFSNGERVTRVLLASDDLIELGHTFFLLRDEIPTPDAGSVQALDLEAHETAGTHIATLLPAFAAQLEAMARVASTALPVLLLGETGTGKEVAARTVHALSGRSGAFVAVNCGALPETLVESQLFGHVKGAFSGAVNDALGFVRAADKGTLFLDEIGDLTLRSQAALLRLLQESEVIPVGATRPIRVDIRVIAATHRPLDAMAARGEFRSDLFARLAGLRVVLPPLRERREDLGVLISSVLRTIAAERTSPIELSPPAARALLWYDWPLNVRELHQALALSTALAGDACIDLAHLPPAIAAAGPMLPSAPESLSAEDERLRAELVLHLESSGGNVSEVARAMGKARAQIHRWVRRFRIDLEAFRR